MPITSTPCRNPYSDHSAEHPLLLDAHPNDNAGVCTVRDFARMSGLTTAHEHVSHQGRLHVVLLGAGASHGSDTASVPPLACTLLEKLQDFAPATWGTIRRDYAPAFRDDFEGAFKTYVDRHKPNLIPFVDDMGHFFFQFRPSSSNLHLALARDLLYSDTFVASLNYDRLMELASYERGVSRRGHFGSKHPYSPVCYPHGCCHLRYPPDYDIKLRQRHFAETVELSSFVVTRHGELWGEEAEYKSLPIMSLFEKGKRTIIGSDFVAEERARFARAIKQADNIAIVGIQVRPRDRHLWLPLAKTKARLIYCAGRSAAKKFQGWSKFSKTNDPDVVLDGYFSESYNDILDLLGVK